MLVISGPVVCLELRRSGAVKEALKLAGPADSLAAKTSAESRLVSSSCLILIVYA